MCANVFQYHVISSQMKGNITETVEALIWFYTLNYETMDEI